MYNVYVLRSGGGILYSTEKKGKSPLQRDSIVMWKSTCTDHIKKAVFKKAELYQKLVWKFSSFFSHDFASN